MDQLLGPLILFVILWIVGVVKARAERAAAAKRQFEQRGSAAAPPAGPGGTAAEDGTLQPEPSTMGEFRKLLREMAEVEQPVPVPETPRRAPSHRGPGFEEEDEDIDAMEEVPSGDEEGGYEDVLDEESAESERRRREVLARLESTDEDAVRRAPAPLVVPKPAPVSLAMDAARAAVEQHAGEEGSHATHFVEGVPPADLIAGTRRALPPHLTPQQAALRRFVEKVNRRPPEHQLVIMAEVMSRPRADFPPADRGPDPNS